MGETYIFYADTYFIQNTIMKAGTLWLVMKILRIENTQKRKSVMKIMGIAVVATLSEIVGLFFVPNYMVFLAMAHLIEIPAMLLCLVGRDRKRLWHGIVLGYFWTLVINGVVEALWNLIHLGWLYPLVVLFSVVFVAVLTAYLRKRWRMTKGIYPVEIHCPDIIWTVKGFYDSGNRLQDPYGGKGVHIITKHLAGRLGLQKGTGVCIPYTALGDTKGLIDVYYVEEMRVQKGGEWVSLTKVPLAVAEDELLQGKQYEMILNEELW